MNDQRKSTLSKLTSHIPPGQFGRYLLVGSWNTLFGYGSFAALTAELQPFVPHGYVLASIIASFLNITVSYLGYKFFVFKTKGNYLSEWMRCFAVYSGAIVLGLVLLPLLVFAIRHATRFDSAAPYIAGALLTGFSVIYCLLGHKSFSFRTTGASSQAPLRGGDY